MMSRYNSGVNGRSYSQCGSFGNQGNSTCKMVAETTAQDSAHIKGLNDRLARFVDSLKAMCQGGSGQVDSSKYHETISLLENEICKQRNCYEVELERLRKQLDQCSVEKNSLSVKIQSEVGGLSDFKSRIQALECSLQKAHQDSQICCASLAAKDKTIADLECCLKNSQTELDTLKRELGLCRTQADQYKNKYDSDITRVSAMEGRYHTAMEKCQFDNKNKDAKIRDLEERLRAFSGVIVSLEQKINQTTNGTRCDVTALLQKCRDGTMAEIQAHQKATEQAVSQSLQTLKCQMDVDSKSAGACLEENQRLKETIQNYINKFSSLEGQLTACCSEKDKLVIQLNQERSTSAQQISSFQQKLRDLQTEIMNKVAECGLARDQQTALLAEINSYKTLVDAAECSMQECTKSVNGRAPTYSRPQVKSSGYSPGPSLVRAQTSMPTYGGSRVQSAVHTGYNGSGPQSLPPLNSGQCGAGGCRSTSITNILGQALKRPSACCDSCSKGGPCDSSAGQSGWRG